MKAIKAIVENGQVRLTEPLGEEGPRDAIVVVMDADPWEVIVRDERPRPALRKAREDALAQFDAGKT